MMIIGIIGALLLAASWIPETWETVRTKKCSANAEFVIIYVVAAFLLLIYSYQIRDPVFVGLNTFVLGESSINLWYKLKEILR